MTLHQKAGHELDWLRRRFTFLPPNIISSSSLVNALGQLSLVQFANNQVEGLESHIQVRSMVSSLLLSDMYETIQSTRVWNTCADMNIFEIRPYECHASAYAHHNRGAQLKGPRNPGAKRVTSSE